MFTILREISLIFVRVHFLNSFAMFLAIFPCARIQIFLYSFMSYFKVAFAVEQTLIEITIHLNNLLFLLSSHILLCGLLLGYAALTV